MENWIVSQQSYNSSLLITIYVSRPSHLLLTGFLAFSWLSWLDRMDIILDCQWGCCWQVGEIMKKLVKYEIEEDRGRVTSLESLPEGGCTIQHFPQSHSKSVHFEIWSKLSWKLGMGGRASRDEWLEGMDIYHILEGRPDQHILLLMEETLRRLEEFTSWKEAMRKCCRINKLNIDIVAYYTPLKFRASYSRFKAIYAKKPTDKSERWIENELKAFYWTCVAISCVQALRITEFGPQEWQTIQKIFYFKQPLTLEYQGKKLVDDPHLRQPWSTQEDSMLSEIVQDCDKDCNKWNQFARKLFQTSQRRFYRTGKQCRQRWLNHLDPSKRHGEWAKEEDMEIVRLLAQEGRKWSLIAKKLGSHRTEHMVKNRFKTILLKQKKEYPTIRNQMVLLRSFLDPGAAERHLRKEEPVVSEAVGAVGVSEGVGVQIKLQHKSQEQLFDSQQQKNLIQEQSEKGQQNLPQTSCAFELPQVYSPCIYMNIPITPTFSPNVPFFVNFSSFSAFDANFSSQFYCSRKASDKLDKTEQDK